MSNLFNGKFVPLIFLEKEMLDKLVTKCTLDVHIMPVNNLGIIYLVRE